MKELQISMRDPAREMRICVTMGTHNTGGSWEELLKSAHQFSVEDGEISWECAKTN